MTTPGSQLAYEPVASPVAHQPVTTFSPSYGTELRGHSATWLDDGRVLYAYTECSMGSAINTNAFRVVIATAPSPSAFVSADDSVTELTWVARHSGTTVLGCPPVPTLSRRDGDSDIYLALTYRLESGGSPVAPSWNLTSGSPPSNGCVLLVSSDQGATWSLKSQVLANWGGYGLTGYPTCTEIYFVDSTTWFLAATGNSPDFGTPIDLYRWQSLDAGASWMYQGRAGAPYSNQVSWVSRQVTSWDGYLRFSYQTDSSVPGATISWLARVAGDGSGADTIYESTTNTAGHLWNFRDSRSLMEVAGALRYYAIKNNDGLEIYETAVAPDPAYTDFSLVYSAYSVPGVTGNNWVADALQKIGPSDAAWMGVDFVVGVSVPSSGWTVGAVGFG